MAETDVRWKALTWVTIVAFLFLLDSAFISAEPSLKLDASRHHEQEEAGPKYFLKVLNFSRKPDGQGHRHVWPQMKFGWRMVVGTIIGFCGAAFGSVGGVGGGGIYVPMLTLIIGFDAKSSTALSKCMILGAAVSSVCYNLNRRHPTLDMPIIDYNLALLIQPMLMLGISIGVSFSVIFADWMVTVLLIIILIVTSTMTFSKAAETWKKETILKKETARCLGSNDASNVEVETQHVPSGTSTITQKETKVPILENVYWKELGFLVFVWVAFFGVQMAKIGTTTCSTSYWILTLMQIPVSLGVTLYVAISLRKGRKVIASIGDASAIWKVHQLFLYCFCGVLAGVLGGLLGLGGGFILGPLFLELGVPPQVSSATATFAMTFSSSMSVVQYYLLKRFPVPYALYLVAVATVAAVVGQHVMRKMIVMLGRASLIIYILAFTIFVSAISLGGDGIADMVSKKEHHEYMGFENLCQ